MKTEKKRVGTKAEIRAIKNRERRIATAIFLVFILLIVIFSSYFTYNSLNQPQNQTTNPASSQLKAAIVDQLSLTFPNQTFIETATNTLKQAGYTVDYYSGDKVTVPFYSDLPAYGYELIVLRVHSTAANPDRKDPPVTLFTSERYDQKKYVPQQLTDQLVIVTFSEEDWKRGITYFGINPSFVTGSMIGRFPNTTIIMMGCGGLDNDSMARAFVQKGAKVYIGWNGPITASQTDQTTIILLQKLIQEKQTIKDAVVNTMEEVRADPVYKSVLGYFP